MYYRIGLLAAVCTLPLAPVSAQSAKTVVDDHNSAYAARDYEAFVSTFAEDAVIILDGIAIEGRDAIAQSYAENFTSNAPQLRVTRQGRLAGGGIAQTQAHILAEGEEVCCLMSTFNVREGQIVQVRIDSNGMGLGG